MNHLEFSQQIKTKYPEYKDVDDILLVRKMLEKYPEYNDRVDTSKMVPVQGVKQPIVQEVPKSAGQQLLDFGKRGVEATFPRLTQRTTGEITPSEVGKDMLRGSLDALSFISRSAIAASQTAGETLGELVLNRNPSAIKNVPSKFVENLGVIETPKGTGVMGVVEDVARGPFIAAPGVGSFIPKTASLLPKIAAGVGDIALGAGLGTAESVAANEGVNPLGAGIGGALGALSPIGRGIKGGADYISNRSVGNEIINFYKTQLLNGNDAEKVKAAQMLRDFGNNPIKMAEEINPILDIFAGGEGNTINQNIKDLTKWKDRATPGPLTHDPMYTAWTNPTPKPATVMDVLAGSVPGVGQLLMGGKVLYNNPHFASDATRILPKGTSTAIRNLGIGVIGSQRKE